jgi:hypothetical protein
LASALPVVVPAPPRRRPAGTYPRSPSAPSRYLDLPERPSQSPKSQNLLLLLVAQNVGHPGGGPQGPLPRRRPGALHQLAELRCPPKHARKDPRGRPLLGPESCWRRKGSHTMRLRQVGLIAFFLGASGCGCRPPPIKLAFMVSGTDNPLLLDDVYLIPR